MILFRQLFDPNTWTYTYLLADPVTRDAIIIDPVLEQVERDLALIAELGVEVRYILETHVHADHITGGGKLRHSTGARFAAGAATGLDCADVLLADGAALVFGNEVIRAISTPGHTDGCTSYAWRNCLFTGDTLLIDACGRTDFQQGSSQKLYDSLQKLLAYPDETLVYPGHDYNGRHVSSVAQEKGVNPYVAGLERAGFEKKMQELSLPRPRLIDVAVPGNLQCGEVG
jgi:glyoxylase-like metal-dependent hydrolase (beta-lactamase superfamily II)